NGIPDTQRIQRLDDGTIEVTDTLSKQDYYRSLRRPLEGLPDGPNTLGLASQLSLDIGQPGTLKPFKKSEATLEYKTSGREETCHVLMLEGVERIFTIDHNAYGQHLFDMVCNALDLRERHYFGMTYRGTPRTDYWLDLNKKLSKQLEKQPWKLEFHIRYYPLDIDGFEDDLTRYCLCLQIRQDIISGQLPCSFQTYVVLGAYAVQSEAGDYDPQTHGGIEYISNMPFAPQSLQTPQMLQRITELHKLHRGQSPVQADRGFLENARRLALYGVEFHKVKTPLNENVSIGVYHSGILVYRGRVRIGRFPWLQLVKLSHKSKTFSITIRAVNIDPRIRVAFLLKPTTGVLGTRKKATTQDDDLYQLCTLNCQCADARLAKRLWESCASQHAFFRLRDSPTPQRPNLTTLFNSRKYHYPDKGICGSGTVFPSSDPTKRKQPRINRVQTQRKPAQFASDGVAPVAYSEDPDQFYILPGSPSPLPADAVNVNVLQNLPPAYRRPGATRVPLAQEYWRMSPADCTPGLGMNSDGTDVAAMANTDWQGCRCNRGVKWPGAYFFEAIMIEEGSVRLGWSTNNANLILGTDSNGFGYGVDQDACRFFTDKICFKSLVSLVTCAIWWSNQKFLHREEFFLTVVQTDPKKLVRPNPSGLLFHGNVPEQYGLNVSPGDCIGCYLELDSDGKRLSAQWSHNGQLLGPAPLRKPCSISVNDSLFPAASLKDARVAFNFGYRPFRFPPTHYSTSGAPWVPVANTPEVNRVGNRNVGWRVNPADVSSSTNLLISPNGRMVQAVANTGWQGFRVNKGICGGGKYYYEVKVMEDSGLARIGWSLDGANLDLGYDAFGYGFGADRDGFGITGHQGKKLHGDVIENYGEAFGKDDVIGCFLDLDTGVVQWSKNGRLFGSAYWLPEQFLKQGDPIFPAASLVDTTLELNYGDLPFEFPPEVSMLHFAPKDNAAVSL
ncbi:FERM central domain protein, partial [Opisthorchis viverrini]